MAGAGFEWIGPEGETRLLLHRGCGYSIPIPGRPSIAAEKDPGPPARDVVVALSDPPMELGFRLDTLPAGPQPEALAATLALAHASARASETPAIHPQPALARAVGADAVASAIYPIGTAALAVLEHLMVLVRAAPEGLWVLYWTVRFSRTEVNSIRWAHVRTAVTGKQHWDPAAPRTAAPPLWPPSSAFAELSAALEWTEPAWTEAQAKAADLGPLADDQATALLRLLIELSLPDDPPTHEVHPYLIQLMTQRIAQCGPSRAAETLLRNLEQVKTTHDLRAWCWQCAWAIGNNAALTPEQRSGGRLPG